MGRLQTRSQNGGQGKTPESWRTAPKDRGAAGHGPAAGCFLHRSPGKEKQQGEADGGSWGAHADGWHFLCSMTEEEVPHASPWVGNSLGRKGGHTGLSSVSPVPRTRPSIE